MQLEASPPSLASVATDPVAAFAAGFTHLRALHQACITSGLLVVAVDGGGRLLAHAHLVDDGEHAVVGAHHRCRLALPGDPQVAMRHAVVALTWRADGPALAAWAVGPAGLVGVDGTPYGSLTTRGPAAFAIGAIRVFAFATGPTAPRWTAAPATTWAGLPARAVTGTVFPVRPGAGFDDLPTAAADAARASLRVRTLGVGGEVIGVLSLDQGELRATVPVTDAGLARGILIGRADRCDAGGRFAALSRLHALVASSDHAVWLFDVASRNGITVAGAAVPRCRLDPGTTVALGGALTATWRPSVGRPPAQQRAGVDT